MNRWTRRMAMAAAAMAVAAGAALAADDPGTDVPLATDLTAVIALQGLPCGQVASATRQAQDDYLVTCQDGNRYRIQVNAEGRVVVTRQQ
jgi:hypothetical protein